MKKPFIYLIMITIEISINAQVPQGFNYQAVARDNNNQVLANTELIIRIGIISDTYPQVTVWEEEHAATTNSLGLFSLTIGDPDAAITGGNVASFTEINWSGSPMLIRTRVYYGEWYELGKAQLWSVPYAMISEKAYENLSSPFLFNGDTVYVTENFSVGSQNPMKAKLAVTGDDYTSEDALFEVKRSDGQTVFAVYNEGVRVYLPTDPLTKGPKGGFAIGGFDRTKGVITEDYMHVTADSIRMYIDKTPDGKGPKGGFAIGGFDRTKAIIDNYILLNADSTRFYIDDTNAKGPKGGFAIGGFDRTKASSYDYLRITQDSTRFYIDDTNAKGPKGGFAIGGFDRTKGTNISYFDVATDTMGIISPSENRVLWYPLKNAFITGKVIVESPDSVGTNSFSAGFETKAIGDWSQALGYRAITRGDYSTSIGKNSTAISENSVSIGNHSRADALSSFAFGTGAISSGINSYAIGSAGVDSAGYPTGNTMSVGEQSFAIGMGAESTGFGSFSIGTESRSDGDFSFAIGYKSYTNGYYSTAIGKSARATESYAMAIGKDAWASAAYSISIGSGMTTGKRAVAIGQGSAENMGSICIGGYYKFEELAPGSFVFARHDSKATGDGSMAIGHGVEAIGNFSTAIGYYSKALGSTGYTTAMGYYTDAWGPYSVAIGPQTNTSGMYATALGYKTTAQARSSTVVGTNNIVSGNISSWIGSDPVFVVGNGYTTPSNAMTILKNGNTGIGVLNPTTRLSVYTNNPGNYAQMIHNDGNSYTSHGMRISCGNDLTSSNTTYAITFLDGDHSWVGSISIRDHTVHYNTSSDQRLKTGIKATKLNGIELLKKIPVVDFSFKDLPDKSLTGFIAQDILDVFPDAVSQNDEGYYLLSYPSLIPLLTKAIQEQQQLILEKDQKIRSLEERLVQIESILGIDSPR